MFVDHTIVDQLIAFNIDPTSDFSVINGQHDQFTSKAVLEQYQLGTKSNISRIQQVLMEKDFIVSSPEGLYLSDPILELWLKSK